MDQSYVSTCRNSTTRVKIITLLSGCAWWDFDVYGWLKEAKGSFPSSRGAASSSGLKVTPHSDEERQRELIWMEVVVWGTLRASLSGTFLQTLPDLVTPLKGHSLSPHSCPPTRSAPSKRSGTNKTAEAT